MNTLTSDTHCESCKKIKGFHGQKLLDLYNSLQLTESVKLNANLEQKEYLLEIINLKKEANNFSNDTLQKRSLTVSKFSTIFVDFSYKTYFQILELFDYLLGIFSNVITDYDDILVISMIITLNTENKDYQIGHKIYDIYPQLKDSNYTNNLLQFQNFICNEYLQYYFPMNVFLEFILYICENYFFYLKKISKKKKGTPSKIKNKGDCYFKFLIISMSAEIYKNILEEHVVLECSKLTLYYALFYFVLNEINRIFQNDEHFNSTIFFSISQKINLKEIDLIFLCVNMLKEKYKNKVSDCLDT